METISIIDVTPEDQEDIALSQFNIAKTLLANPKAIVLEENCATSIVELIVW